MIKTAGEKLADEYGVTLQPGDEVKPCPHCDKGYIKMTADGSYIQCSLCQFKLHDHLAEYLEEHEQQLYGRNVHPGEYSPLSPMEEIIMEKKWEKLPSAELFVQTDIGMVGEGWWNY